MQQSISLGQPSVLSQLRALLAVTKKEWIVFRRYPSWVIAFFIWPILFPFGFIFTAKALSGPDDSALATFGELAGTTDYAGYVVLGVTLWIWLNLTLWDVGFHLRNEQMRGTLESNWLCPVWRISIILGSSVTKLGTSLFFLAMTVIECRLLLGIHLLSGNVPLTLLIVLLLIPSIYGIGLAFASLVIRFKEANTMVFFVRGIFMIFCGMSYPLEVLPTWMQHIAAFLPLTYATRGIRKAALANADWADLQGDLGVLALFALVLPVAGGLAFRYAERRARQTGALGQY
jgi:ABC-2 type transport system permease protein